MSKEAEAKNLIPLSEAEEFCEYSADYLKLRARQGKLKAEKDGRIWVTKKSWVEEYEEKMERYWELRHEGVSPEEASDRVFPLKKEEAEEETRVEVREVKVRVVEEAPSKEVLVPSSFVLPSLKKAAPILLVLLFVFMGISLGSRADISFLADEVKLVLEEPTGEAKEASYDFLARFAEDNVGFFKKALEFAGSGAEGARSFAREMTGGKLSGLGKKVGRVFPGFENLAELLEPTGEKIEIVIGKRPLLSGPITLWENYWRGMRNDIGQVRSLFDFESPVRVPSSLGERMGLLRERVVGIFTGLARLLADSFKREEPEREPEKKVVEVGKTKEGVVVIPEKLQEEGMEEKIQKAFSDEVKVEPEDERSGVLRPVFKEGTGEDYKYMLVPIVEDED